MAGFRTHITTSTILGVGYGAAGYALADMPLATSMLATGLCSVSGMLPDLDSDSGVPLRESMAFAAAVIPMLMLDRFQQMGLSNESMVLAAGLIYIAVRFGVAEMFRRYTVHRGMWHSVPAALIATLLAFLIVSGSELDERLFKTGGVLIGFLSHLVLDELYSIQWKGGRWRFKRSFGTALKFWDRKSLWANVSTYAKLIILVAMAVGDPVLMQRFEYDHRPVEDAQQIIHTAREKSETLLRR